MKHPGALRRERSWHATQRTQDAEAGNDEKGSEPHAVSNLA
jgi:hypothetical protein